jgi:hypothetical protein
MKGVVLSETISTKFIIYFLELYFIWYGFSKFLNVRVQHQLLSYSSSLERWSTGSPWPTLRSDEESRCWERERKSKRGASPVGEWSRRGGAPLGQLRGTGRMWQRRAWVDTELTARLPARKKVTASAHRRLAMVVRKWRGEAELGRSGAAPRRWRGCLVRHRQDGDQASTGGASALASSVWRAPDGALGDASPKTETASGARWC